MSPEFIASLNAASLARARSTQSAMWDKSCDVLRRTPATDAYGRPSAGVEAVCATLPCSLGQQTGRNANTEAQQSDRALGVGLWVISAPWDADVQDKDRIRVFDLSPAGERVGDGRLFDVIGTNGGQSHAFQTLVYAKSSE